MIQADPGARLAVTISSGMTVEVRLGLREVRIGRSREADLQLPDPSVSRLHARIFRVGRQYFLADMGSRNGTHLDGKAVSQAPLECGRSFRVGPYRIHFFQEGNYPGTGEEPTVAAAAAGSPAGIPFPGPSPATQASGTAPDAPFGLVGGSVGTRKLIDMIRRVGPSDVPVLIEGETGSGKELVARGIHDASARRDRPFVVVNCGAISPELVESELFGHEKGAFTGATAQRKGAFELAHNGTIFLDEIGELPFALQPKLLRALEQREIKRVGGNETILADVRILSATHRNLREEIARKTFREDLYFRIGAITVPVPPLRDHREDVPAIARHFLAGMERRSGRPVPVLSPDALDALISHYWPGNVRELRNAVQRAVVMGEGPGRTAADFSFLGHDAPGTAGPPAAAGLSRWEQAERTNILAELARQDGNKTRTARELGIAKSTLFEKLKKYGIRTPGSGR
ncbi:MAG TPA: sigma 54-interacting transcriptional regulator [Candidatus Deferrimicrobiaceae bacterium]